MTGIDAEKGTSPFDINRRFDSYRDELMQDQKIWEQQKGLYWEQKYHSYIEAFHHLHGPSKKAFYLRMCRELKRAIQKQELDSAMFSNKEWRSIRKMIMKADGGYTVIRLLPGLKQLIPFIPRPIKRIVTKWLFHR